jgi:CHAT domain-containing protein
VSDEGTKELMTSFYKNLIKKRMSKDEALRQAKIEMIGRKDNDSKMEKASDETLRSVKITGRSKSLTYSHPFFWSAFVMYGE